jgi:hypothetical protein
MPPLDVPELVYGLRAADCLRAELGLGPGDIEGNFLVEGDGPHSVTCLVLDLLADDVTRVSGFYWDAIGGWRYVVGRVAARVAECSSLTWRPIGLPVTCDPVDFGRAAAMVCRSYPAAPVSPW